VVIAGAFVLAGGSAIVDPIVGLVIAALILASSWRLIKEPVEVLMEAAPTGLDVDSLGEAICGEEGVRSVHDLHVWTVTPGFGALSAHVVVLAGADRDLIMRRLEFLMHERFGIDHTTLQMEEEASEELLEVERAPPEG
jgi:cobalt-zinc-cadmium efflux system protein